jgi:hypothetical protein
MNDIPKDKRIWHIRSEIHYRSLADGGMLFDAEGRCVHHLNASAACVWEACQEGAPLTKITTTVCARFEVEWEEAENDIKGILCRFQRAQLLLE